MASSFTSIPILDYSLSTGPSKPAFIASLRNALVHVGFFYLRNAPISIQLQDELVRMTRALFDLPLHKKLEIEMLNSKHFLGYSRLGAEITARKADHREQFDFATELPPPGPDEPLYRNIRGPNQWPDETSIPGFRAVIELYLAALRPISDAFETLIAEALGMPPTALQGYFDSPRQHKMKLVRYPPPLPSTGESDSQDTSQGVGPHVDSEFLTFLYQATPHAGLEVQNKNGEWIPAPPIENTLVVNIGRALESVTGGVCTATTHRVRMEPGYFEGLGDRFSIPVFQGMSLELTGDIGLVDMIPESVKGEADWTADGKVKSDADQTFSKDYRGKSGEGTLIHRVMSHQDVGRRWYPELLEYILRRQGVH